MKSTRLIALINNRSHLFVCSGVAIEGQGIFDEQGVEYPAGMDADGKLHASTLNEKGEITRTDSNIPLDNYWSVLFNNQK